MNRLVLRNFRSFWAFRTKMESIRKLKLISTTSENACLFPDLPGKGISCSPLILPTESSAIKSGLSQSLSTLLHKSQPLNCLTGGGPASVQVMDFSLTSVSVEQSFTFLKYITGKSHPHPSGRKGSFLTEVRMTWF